MADYGIKPWEWELLTYEEAAEVLKHQNDRWEAIRSVQAKQARPKRRR